MVSTARTFSICRTVELVYRFTVFRLAPFNLFSFLKRDVPFQNLCWLEEKEKEVVSALRYFKTIVDKMAIDKKVLEMLPGSATKVLEAILPLVQIDLQIQHR